MEWGGCAQGTPIPPQLHPPCPPVGLVPVAPACTGGGVLFCSAFCCLSGPEHHVRAGAAASTASTTAWGRRQRGRRRRLIPARHLCQQAAPLPTRARGTHRGREDGVARGRGGGRGHHADLGGCRGGGGGGGLLRCSGQGSADVRHGVCGGPGGHGGCGVHQWAGWGWGQGGSACRPYLGWQQRRWVVRSACVFFSFLLWRLLLSPPPCTAPLLCLSSLKLDASLPHFMPCTSFLQFLLCSFGITVGGSLLHTLLLLFVRVCDQAPRRPALRAPLPPVPQPARVVVVAAAAVGRRTARRTGTAAAPPPTRSPGRRRGALGGALAASTRRLGHPPSRGVPPPPSPVGCSACPQGPRQPRWAVGLAPPGPTRASGPVTGSRSWGGGAGKGRVHGAARVVHMCSAAEALFLLRLLCECVHTQKVYGVLLGTPAGMEMLKTQHPSSLWTQAPSPRWWCGVRAAPAGQRALYCMHLHWTKRCWARWRSVQRPVMALLSMESAVGESPAHATVATSLCNLPGCPCCCLQTRPWTTT